MQCILVFLSPSRRGSTYVLGFKRWVYQKEVSETQPCRTPLELILHRSSFYHCILLDASPSPSSTRRQWKEQLNLSHTQT